MGQSYAWLDAMVGTVRCSACRTPYARPDLRVVGDRDGYVFVRCDCRSCKREGIAVVFAELAAPPKPRRRPITSDDVLSAHEILGSYTGNAEGLFLTEAR